jgi:peptidoglycan hydrolase-like protein with peptidoglycan-binding domain
MRTKAIFAVGSVAIAALLIAGVSYWAVRKYSHSISSAAQAPSVQTLRALENTPSTSPQLALPSTASVGQEPAPSQPIAARQSGESPGLPSAPSAVLKQSRLTGSEKLPSTSAMPDEDRMSEANRRQVQQALQSLGYYDGPVDGILGPLTRASIIRFQDSIGAKATGVLTATEAGRLVGLAETGTAAGAQGTEGLEGIPESPVGHRQPTQADLPLSVRHEEQGTVLAPDNSATKAQNTTPSHRGSNHDKGDKPSTYGQIPSICTRC